MIGIYLFFTFFYFGHATHFITKVNETVHHNVILQENETWDPEMYAKKIIMKNFTGVLTIQSFSLLTKVEEIYFAHSTINNIHQDAFKSVPPLKTLQFSYNKYLPAITNEMLRNCRNLKKFIMGHNKYVEQISENLFSNMQNLTHIEVTKENKLPKRLTRNLFENSKTLESIKLHFSNITAVDSEAFKDLPKLQFLSLTENEIEEIDSAALRGSDLTQVYLGWNKLNSFTGRELTYVNSLQILDISFNPLRKFDLEGIRKNAPHLKVLGLKKTDLSCQEKREIKKQASYYLEIEISFNEIEKCET